MSASATMKASEAVLAVLRQATIDDEGLTLVGELDRKSYQDVNKFLEAAGAKWNKKAKRHLFTGNSKAEIEGLLGTGQIVHKKNLYQSFYTPEPVAKRVIAMAELSGGDICLEPSAGGGALATLADQAGANVTCVDIDPVAVARLQELGFAVFHQDFLTCSSQQLDGPFDRIVMNPPFTKNQAFEHVIYAMSMLRSPGILVAIVPPSTPTSKALRAKWESLLDEHLDDEEEVDAGAFKESGTNVRTRIIKLTA